MFEGVRDDIDVQELLESPKKNTETAKAIKFLEEKFATETSIDSKEIMEDAKANGIKSGTLYRAKDRLGIVAKKKGLKGPWVWEKP